MDFNYISFLDKKVPELIFGSLTMAPLQRNLSPTQGGEVISEALNRGLRWIDTAQMYGSYPHVREGIKNASVSRRELVISTKSTAKTAEEMQIAVDEALRVMELETIDLFLLHAVKSKDDFIERAPALNRLISLKEMGVIKSIGISTHSTECAKALYNDSRIEWYHLMFNKLGTGLTDGTLDDQLAVIKAIKERGAKVYAMKPLGGGYLKDSAEESLNWVKNHPLIDAVALGMTNLEELDMNIRVFRSESVPMELSEKCRENSKKLFIFKALCIGCKKCAEVCDQHALTIIENKAVVHDDRCILCGYCVPSCPKFAIRLI